VALTVRGTDPPARPSLTAVPAASSEPFISIVMPCLNEQQTVVTCVTKALGWLERSGYAGEVLVVDNGSTDGSDDLARAAGARVEYENRRGYGAALRRGFALAYGDWLIMGDCDNTYEFSELDDLVAPLAEGYELAVGDRFAGGIAAGAMTWSHRYIGTPAISFLIKMFCGLSIGDSQCGLRAFTRDVLDRLELRTDGMELASEMIVKAARRGVRVANVPVPYGERLGVAKLNTLRDGWRHLRFLLLATPNFLFTIPGVLLALTGVLILGLALPAEGFVVGDITWQPVFAGGIFVVVGVNAILLGFASRLYTTSRGITNEDVVLRFYHRHLDLERFILLGGAFVTFGLAFDLMLAFVHIAGVNRTDLYAIAQTSIIVGANTVLVGALASLLEEK
jgi:glycosyltransferase involved in cell wall biosynthesis